MQIIRSRLPKTPITQHGHSDSTRLGWLKQGDPRSELVLSLFQESGDRNLSILLNGLPDDDDDDETTANPSSEQPTISKAQLDAINPIAQVRKRTYKVPTFLIHGSEDEVLPCEMSVKFSEALREKGVEGGLLVVDGAKHLHDLGVEPGSEGWEKGVGEGYAWLLGKLGVE